MLPGDKIGVSYLRFIYNAVQWLGPPRIVLRLGCTLLVRSCIISSVYFPQCLSNVFLSLLPNVYGGFCYEKLLFQFLYLKFYKYKLHILCVSGNFSLQFLLKFFQRDWHQKFKFACFNLWAKYFTRILSIIYHQRYTYINHN